MRAVFLAKSALDAIGCFSEILDQVGIIDFRYARLCRDGTLEVVVNSKIVRNSDLLWTTLHAIPAFRT